jgi:hypothetical protein
VTLRLSPGSSNADRTSLYCSSECRLQDKGTPSPALKAGVAPVRLTSQLPHTLSPLFRPTPQIAPSPKMPGVSGDTSSASSITSSPLHSPRTNPSGSDSPQKEAFNLPPPAFPAPASLVFPGSMPVKIPALATRPSLAHAQQPTSQTPGSHGSTIYPTGTSIDTLRFGRKPSVTNSVISPNGLVARCACGKPANHRSRASSKERIFDPLDSGFSRLNLGPSLVPHHPTPLAAIDKRIVSDSVLAHPQGISIEARRAQSGHGTPAPLIGSGSGSLLARSRSDPIPPSPSHRHSVIAPMTTRELSVISPTRRASAADGRQSGAYAATGMVMSRTGSATHRPAHVHREPAPATSTGTGLALDMGRGRSRERQLHPRVDTSVGLLNHPPEREAAPSRSCHRRDESERERERLARRLSTSRERVGEDDADDERTGGRRGRDATATSTLPPAQPPQITPSCSRGPEGLETIISPRKGWGEVASKSAEPPRNERPVAGAQEGDDARGRARTDLGEVFGTAA